VSTTWDFTGALVSYAKLATPPTVNPSFSQYDAHGNQLYNSSSHAYLVLASGFLPAARVAGVSPSSAPQGSTVTITGTGFTGASAVTFGTLAAPTYVVDSDTMITAVTPAVRTGTVDVTVANAGGTSITNSSDQFTFVLTPRVSSLSGGTKVTITGDNFTRGSVAAFGGVPAHVKFISAKSIVATAPAGSDSGVTVDVAVTSSHGTSALSTADRYTYSG
jgi:hypothetical protein